LSTLRFILKFAHAEYDKSRIMKYRLFFLSLFLTSFCIGNSAVSSSPRVHSSFDNGWRFSLQASDDAAGTSFNDSGWRLLNLPHDWAIEGSFSKDNPAGTGGGALPGGVGWYRKTFFLHHAPANKHYFIDFDGVYMNSQVFLNGHLLGVRPYGYISFQYELTPYLNRNGKNVIAVKVDNEKQPNSRWYSGCGIYRHVYWTETGDVHIAHWGTQITTPQVSSTQATVNIRVALKNENSQQGNVKITNRILNEKGVEVAVQSSSTLLEGKSTTDQVQTLSMPNPTLWTIDHPAIYTVKTTVEMDHKIVDTYTSTFGVRTFSFDARTGFSLNGKNMKLNGVCNHHDLGCLGAALNEAALHRQLKILKEMGCNAIRCTHNPPAPELLAMCDSMGFIVMDEAFDMWHRKKTTYDYGNYFDHWYRQDLTNLVLRDRNHPCVMLWSIGNEIPEQRNNGNDTISLEEAKNVLRMTDDEVQQVQQNKIRISALMTRKLAEIVKNLDATRPVTAACDEPSTWNNLFQSDALDLIGFNYHNKEVLEAPQNFPGKPFFISESVSAFETRGYYKMPSDSLTIASGSNDPSFKCSSYDNFCAGHGSVHEVTWNIVKNHPYISGQFIWTGFDYLGEPAPYGWPARSSYFGIVDLAGFPKDIYYMYQSEWTDKPVLHLFPHWNWTPGQKIDLWAYYNNADEVELFINGKSQGISRKTDDRFHALWHCIFEPGTVKAVARRNGRVVGEQTIHTAGEPAAIRLTPDKQILKADGRDLCFVTVDIVDRDGNLCPNAESEVRFQVNGAAFIAGVDNGSEISMESFKAHQRKAFYGKCLVVLQNDGNKGSIKLSATSDKLKSATLRIGGR